jgi:adenylate cyclase
MPIEIERKFLVNPTAWSTVKPSNGTPYRQGYLTNGAGATVRIRLAGAQAWLTIKGKTTGLARSEYEYSIPTTDAQEMLDTLAVSELLKTRYIVIHEGKRWEVDEFHGSNEGLLTAELELVTEDENFALPPWVTEEVTADKRYSNSYLAERPFGNW